MKYPFALGPALLAACVLAPGAARADDPTPEPPPLQSPSSRAQVQGELQAYRRAGVNPWSTSYNQLRGFRSSETRDGVMAEMRRNAERTRALTSEDSGAAYLAAPRELPMREREPAVGLSR